MRILILSPYSVYPPTFGGQVRIFSIAKYLVNLANDVTIMCNYTGKIQEKDIKVDGVKIKYFKTYIQDIAAFFHEKRLLPLIISYPFHKILSFLFRRLLIGSDYDIVQFEQPFLAAWTEPFPKKTLKIYSSQNVEVDFDLINFKRSLFYPIYKWLLKKCEKEALSLGDHIIAVSKEDKRRIMQLYGIKPKEITVVANGFETNNRKVNKINLRKKFGLPLNSKIAVFVGSDTPPNLNAVREIVENIAPTNRNTLFLLVGKSANAYKKEQSNIIKIGKVNNPDDYISLADIGLLPVAEGSGTNIKLLNYLKFNLGVISTKFGIRGYEDLEKYIMVSPLEEFSTSLLKFKKKHVSKSLLKKYKWVNLVNKLNNKYKEMLS